MFNEFMLAVTIILALVGLCILLYLGFFTGPDCGGLCGGQ